MESMSSHNAANKSIYARNFLIKLLPSCWFSSPNIRIAFFPLNISITHRSRVPIEIPDAIRSGGGRLLINNATEFLLNSIKLFIHQTPRVARGRCVVIQIVEIVRWREQRINFHEKSTRSRNPFCELRRKKHSSLFFATVQSAVALIYAIFIRMIK